MHAKPGGEPQLYRRRCFKLYVVGVEDFKVGAVESVLATNCNHRGVGNLAAGRDCGGSAAEVETITMVDTPAALAEANATVQVMHGNASGAWTSWTNNSFVYGMNVLWQVNFTEPLPPLTWAALTAPRASTRGPPIATVDEINMAGAVIRNNTFTKTACNLGRFKSPGGSITGNRFSDASLRNLEVTPLLQWFEGPIVLDGMQIENNIFTGVGADPIHCGPLCEMSVVRV